MESHQRFLLATLLLAYPQKVSREKLFRVMYGDKYPESADLEFDAALEKLSDEIPWDVMSSKGCYYLSLGDAAYAKPFMAASEIATYEFVKNNPGLNAKQIAHRIGTSALSVYGRLQFLKSKLKIIGNEELQNAHKGYRIVALEKRA